MREIIIERLKELSSEREIKILYACESGSRAWGFPSPDSDFDVRFIYVESLDWHLSLNDQKDTIDIPINDELDIGGWELKKTLNLLRKSNAPLLEWIQSPIIYSLDHDFLSEIQKVSEAFFSPIACMHHYLSMSKKYTEACIGVEKVKLKRYFYALRTAMAGKWIRLNGSIAPIQLQEMLQLNNDEINDKINQLIDLKSSKNEDYLHPQEPLLNEFLKETIEENEKVAESLRPGNGNLVGLNDLFITTIKRYQYDN